MNDRTVSASFPIQLEAQTRIAAAIAGISRSELIRRAVTMYLAQLEKTGVKPPTHLDEPEATTDDHAK